MRTGIIFDIDGTLWDATDVIAKSYEKTAEKAGLHTRITGDMLRALFGRTMHVIGESLFPELPAEERHALIARCVVEENDWLREKRPAGYPHMAEIMEILSESRPLYLVSNCGGGYPEAFMEATGTESFFSGHLCPDDTGHAKADNIRILMEREKLDRAYYVGDLDLDRIAAEEAGALFIHAAYGYGECPEASLRIADIRELPELLTGLEQ